MFGKPIKQVVEEKVIEPIRNAIIIAWSAMVIAILALVVAVAR